MHFQLCLRLGEPLGPAVLRDPLRDHGTWTRNQISSWTGTPGAPYCEGAETHSSGATGRQGQRHFNPQSNSGNDGPDTLRVGRLQNRSFWEFRGVYTAKEGKKEGPRGRQEDQKGEEGQTTREGERAQGGGEDRDTKKTRVPTHGLWLCASASTCSLSKGQGWSCLPPTQAVKGGTGHSPEAGEGLGT